MPIRFRCAYCNQLMGISRRKAGTVVKCPNCAGQVVVPNLEDEGEGPPSMPSDPHAVSSPNPQLFERSDFEDAFGGSEKPAVPPPMSVPPLKPTMVPPSVVSKGANTGQARDVERFEFVPVPVPPAPAPPSGVVLSPTVATLLSVAVVVALALAFTAGLVVGKYYLSTAPPDTRNGASQSCPALASFFGS